MPSSTANAEQIVIRLAADQEQGALTIDRRRHWDSRTFRPTTRAWDVI